MEKKLTAIGKVLEELGLDMKGHKLAKDQANDEEYTKWVDAVMWGINSAIIKLTLELSNERETIEQAWNDGYVYDQHSGIGTGKQYFNRTFI